MQTFIAVSYTHLDVYKRQEINRVGDKLKKALELRYGDKHLREVYYAQLRTRRQRSGESLQEFEASIDSLIRLAYPEAPED